mgnify:FL=1
MTPTVPNLTRHSLLCHPTGQCAAIRAMDVSAAVSGNGSLVLTFCLQGDLSGIRLPAPQPPSPADGLWQHTCCEAFIAAVDGAEYREFNFSPSAQWAVYDFNDYRERAPDFHALVAPEIIFTPQADGFLLQATLPRALLPAGEVFHLGLTTVIEAADGRKSYWALQHCAAQPDFHLRQSFVLTLKVNAS